MLKINKRLLCLLAASTLILSGCSSKNNSGTTSESPFGAAASADDQTVNLVKNHAYTSDFPDTPLKDVINKYVTSPQWHIISEDGVEKVTVTGKIKNVDKDLIVSITVKPDPEDGNSSLLDVVTFGFGNVIITTSEAWDYLLDLYDYYGNGANDLTELNNVYMSYFTYPLPQGFEWADIPTVFTTKSGGLAISGMIRNKSNAPTYATIKFTLFDENNNLLGEISDEISVINTGDTWEFVAAIPESLNNFYTWDISRFGTSKYDDSDFEKVSVKELYDELDSNALRAETKYQDKLLEITGYIDVIDSDGKYFSIASSADSWSLKTVQCDFTDDTQKQIFVNMNQGDLITVRVKIKSIGEIMGYSADLLEIK